MREHTPSDKIKFLALGELPAPGACFVCGSGVREEGYVDLGVYVDYHGEAMLCQTCLIEAAECIGMLSIEEAQIIHGRNSIQQDELAELKATVNDQNERLSAYATLMRNPRPDPIVSTGLSRSDFDTSTEQSASGSDDRESAPEESVTGDGRLASVGASQQDNGSGTSEPQLFEL